MSATVATRPRVTDVTTTQDDPLLRLYDAEQRKIRHRLIAAFVVLGLVIGALVGGFYLARSTAATATDERNVAASSADQLAGKVLSDCAQTSTSPTDGPDASTCAQAREVQADPVVQQGARGERGPIGATGASGLPGPEGRGITAVRVNAAGRLIVTFTDGATQDVGAVIGPVGVAGVDGKDGTNGADGADGVDGVNGRDGTNGVDGQPPSGWQSTEPDGSVTTCTRVADFDPTSPQYQCTNAPAGG